MEQVSLSALREATRSTERTLDALRLVDAPRSKLERDFSLTTAMTDLQRERRTGANAEFHQEVSRHQIPAHSNSIFVPWSVVARAVRASFATRADTVAAAGTGGNLVETSNLTAADALRPDLLCGPLGQTIIPAPHGSNVNLPLQKTAATAFWLSTETATATETEQSFGQIAFSPRTVCAYTEISRLLKLQSNADQIIARDLARVLARAVDKGQLFGTGINGQMNGLTTVTTGVQSFSAASTTTATLTNAQVSLGDAVDDTTGVATTLTIAGALRSRNELGAGSQAMWQGALGHGTVVGLPARSSTAVTAGTMIVGSWAYLNLVVWGALEISVNPYAQFQSGIQGIRAFMTCDSGVTFPAAFTIGTSFS
jgi:HK97 family phage major capsid protein